MSEQQEASVTSVKDEMSSPEEVGDGAAATGGEPSSSEVGDGAAVPEGEPSSLEPGDTAAVPEGEPSSLEAGDGAAAPEDEPSPPEVGERAAAPKDEPTSPEVADGAEAPEGEPSSLEAGDAAAVPEDELSSLEPGDGAATPEDEPSSPEVGDGTAAPKDEPFPPEVGDGAAAAEDELTSPEVGDGAVAPEDEPSPPEVGDGAAAPEDEPTSSEVGDGAAAPEDEPTSPEVGDGSAAPEDKPSSQEAENAAAVPEDEPSSQEVEDTAAAEARHEAADADHRTAADVGTEAVGERAAAKPSPDDKSPKAEESSDSEMSRDKDKHADAESLLGNSSQISADSSSVTFTDSTEGTDSHPTVEESSSQRVERAGASPSAASRQDAAAGSVAPDDAGRALEAGGDVSNTAPPADSGSTRVSPGDDWPHQDDSDPVILSGSEENSQEMLSSLDLSPGAVSSADLPVVVDDSAGGDMLVPSTQGGQASWSRNLSIAPSGDEYDEKDDPQLVENNMVSDVDAQVIYALFDEYSGQLEVLGKVIAAPYIKDHVDETETLRQRFRRQEDEPLKIRGTHGENMVPASPHLMKIQADRAYLSKAIERVMKALRRESSHLPLLETVEAEGARRQEFVVIEEDAIANSKSITALQEEIRELKVSMTKEITDRDNRIYELRDELQEVLARTGMEVRYTAASSRARLASNEGQTEQKRLLKRNQAEGARVECDYETRVNTEIESHLRDALDELDDMLDKRLTKFDVDTDTKERELSSLKYQKQQNFQALCDVKDKYANYTRVIAEDDEELRLEEERIKEEERREAAAIVIQSYWKGYKERKKLKKKLRKLRRAAKKAKKAGKGAAASPKPKNKNKKKK